MGPNQLIGNMHFNQNNHNKNTTNNRKYALMTSLTNKEIRFITKNCKISKDSVLKITNDRGWCIGHYVVTLRQLLAMSKLNS